MQPVAGIFVGGRARRMGGRAKGTLKTPQGSTIVRALREACAEAGARVVLVGSAPSRAVYREEGLDGIDDDPRAEGPLAGLLALLTTAGPARAVALACDMPFVTAPLVARLLEDRTDAPVLAPRRGQTWEPFFARLDAARVLPAGLAAASRGQGGLQRLFDELGAAPFVMSVSEERALVDWDEPGQIARFA